MAGVVEAESGKRKHSSFTRYRLLFHELMPSIIYENTGAKGLISMIEVSSQVYHGKCRWEPQILVAVRITEGMVLVDSEMQLITAAFHSNSGGETVGSETVWSGPLPYLTSRVDEFSMFGKHSTGKNRLLAERNGWHI